MNAKISESGWYRSVPAFDKGYFVSEHSADERSHIVEYSGVGERAYYEYIAALEAAGFKARETYTLDKNLYALYDGDKASVYVAYSNKANTVRLYTEEKGATAYPEKGDDAYAGVPDFWQLPLDNKTSVENGGMRYVFRLTDGTFMIIDGGYKTDSDAESLYKFLRENTPCGKQTVISAWFFTHLHYDHYGTLLRFSELYADEIPVKGFYYHFNAASCKEYDVAGAMARWKDAVHYCKLHTGMEFNLPGLKVNVIQTQEDLYPLVPGNYNDASMAFRVTAGGQRILFLGDCELWANYCMLKYLSDEIIKSDIVQFSHHGYFGCTKEYYDIVAAHTVLWPMNVDGYQIPGYNSIPQNVIGFWHKADYGVQNFPFPNRYISLEAPYVKKMLIPAEDNKIELPYTPTGAKLPDFDRIFKERTADYKPE